MSNTVIEVENLYKEYRLGVIGYGTLRQDIQSWWAKIRKKPDPNSLVSGSNDSFDKTKGSFYAVNDISFKVHEGEKVGIIGKNGAGKSTLLKILSRITSPTKGEVRLRGKVASLLEVGTGFHAELTGRENIYLNGAIFGMKKHEVDKQVESIIDFSEIGDFIDTPVKRYSSGMYVRLGFAVAAHLNPDILIVDEVLAVGDRDFQQKCINKMDDVAQKGKTVLFVSHNIPMIRALCDRALVLNKGSLSFDGDCALGIEKYAVNSDEGGGNIDVSAVERSGDLSLRVKLTSVELFSEGEKNPTVISSREPFKVVFEVENRTDRPVRAATEITICDEYERLVFMNSCLLCAKIYSFPPNATSVVECLVEPTFLYSGKYFLDCGLSIPGQEAIDFVPKAYKFEVEELDPFDIGYNLKRENMAGRYHVKHNWSEIL